MKNKYIYRFTRHDITLNNPDRYLDFTPFVGSMSKDVLFNKIRNLATKKCKKNNSIISDWLLFTLNPYGGVTNIYDLSEIPTFISNVGEAFEIFTAGKKISVIFGDDIDKILNKIYELYDKYGNLSKLPKKVKSAVDDIIMELWDTVIAPFLYDEYTIGFWDQNIVVSSNYDYSRPEITYKSQKDIIWNSNLA